MDYETYHNLLQNIEPGIHVNNFGNADISPTDRSSTVEQVNFSNAWQGGRNSSQRGLVATSGIFSFCLFPTSLFRGDADSANDLADAASKIALCGSLYFPL
jgi:hypothetical protein